MRPQSRAKRTLAGALGVLLALCALPGLTSTAQAAPNQVVLDSITFVTQEGVTIDGFEDGTVQWLQAELHAPESATSPVSGTITLPGTLIGQPDRFDLFAPDGTKNGECLVASNHVECFLDDDYVLEHPDNMRGSFRFKVEVALGNTGDTTVTFPVGGGETNEVTVTPKPVVPICQDNCLYPGKPAYKNGVYNTVDGYITWSVHVPAGPDGMVPGTPVVVTDHYDENVYDLRPGSPRVLQFSHAIPGANGVEVIYGWFLPSDQYTVTNNGRTVSFTSQAGSFYHPNGVTEGRVLPGAVYTVQWDLIPKDGGGNGTYTNDATVSVGDQTPGGGSVDPIDVDGSVTRQGGSGEAVGQNNGRLALTKYLDGEAIDESGVPATYRVAWTACDTTKPGYNPITHSGPDCTNSHVDLTPEKTFYLNQMPAGTRVVAHEVELVDPVNVAWDQRFQLVDADGVPIPNTSEAAIIDITFEAGNNNLEKTTYYSVLNTATFAAASFTTRKVVVNDDQVDLDEILNYELVYTWQGENGLESETLLLPADGTLVESIDLPIGTVVTLSEVQPADQNGATWAPPALSVNSITIGDPNAPAEVVVTNTITQDPGTFRIRKAIVNEDDVEINEDHVFRVKYEYTAVGPHPAGEGYLDVLADGDWVISDPIPVGAIVTLSEEPPAGIPGATWDPMPNFSMNNFEMDLELDAIDLTNTITQNLGTFRAEKAFLNPEGLPVPADLSFELQYSYDYNGTTVEGTPLILPADGSSVISDVIPHGAVVTFWEATPPAVPGGQWTTSLNPASGSFIMDADEPTDDPLTVTATNTLDRKVGKFLAHKEILNTGGVDLSSVTDYDLYYTYSSVGGRPGGQGFMTLLADGTVAESPQIPHGALVRVFEVAPTDLHGASWEPPVLSLNEFTIDAEADASTLVNVKVTNEIDLDFGNFRASKVVVNDDDIDLGDVTGYELNYSYTATGSYPAGNGSMTLSSDGSYTLSAPIRHGAVVTVTEVEPIGIPGTDWESEITNDTFTINADALDPVQVLVQNTISLKEASFSAFKTVHNPDGIDLSEVTEYVIEYDYTAVGRYPEGTGTMILSSDGTIVQSDPLPHGTTVTVQEVRPADIAGATWSELKLSVDEFVLDTDAADPLVIEVENTIVKTPVFPPLLGETGGPSTLAWLIIGLLLVGGGTAAVIVTRRRAANRQL